MENRPHLSKASEQPTQSAITQKSAANAGSIEVGCQLEKTQRSLLCSTSALPNTVATRPKTTGNDAAIGIGQTYDRLHRIHAILAYLKVINRNDQWFSPILDEAKHTYEQALSLYEARDYEGALEFASASGDLFQALEIVISSGLRSDSLYPSLVLLPPDHQTSLEDSVRIQEELYRVETLLSLIHRFAENGISLSEDQTQVLNIATCSDRLLRKARHLLRFDSIQEAIDFINAAAATAHAAEHLSKKWLATPDIDPFLPPRYNRAVCDEFSRRDGDAKRVSRTLELQQ